jgi:peptide/nickel transport system substrate-binding protein
MKIKKIVVLYLLFVFLITLVAVNYAAGGTTTLTREEKSGGELMVGLDMEPNILDPWRTNSGYSLHVIGHILDSLVTLDGISKNLNPVPSLAESWEVSEDGTIYTFKLKEGIKFHDGTPFNADAVVFTFEHAMKGNSSASLEGIRDVEKVDDYTVRFVLKSPDLSFWIKIGDTSHFGIVSPTAYEKDKDTWGREALVGTGPFKLEKWIAGQEIVLVRNDEYKHGPDFLDNKGPAYLEKIVFKIIPEPSILVGAVKSGELDIVDRVPSVFVQELKKDSTIQFYSAPSMNVFFGIFNLQRELFQDKRIRLAIAYAINKRPIADVAFSGTAIPTCSLIAPATLGYYDVSDECIEYDPEKSKQFLADAGWKDLDGDGILEKNGKKFEINLLTFTISEFSKSAVVIQDQLKKVGIKVDTEILEFGAGLAKVQSGDSDMSLTTLGNVAGVDLLTKLSDPKSMGMLNWAFYENPEVAELLPKANASINIKGYKEYLKKAQNIVLEDLPYVPLVTTMNSMIANLRVGGLDNLYGEYPHCRLLHGHVIALEAYLKK